MSESFRLIGNYILLEKIAVGGMAEVYLAKSQTSHKFLAIKKILPHHLDKIEYLNQFKEEARLSLQLNHGNIVTFFDVVNEDEHLYLVMDFVNGINVRQLLRDLKIKNIKLSLEQALYIISEVATGLDYAHRSVDLLTQKNLNIIHRDINPNNIMISFDGSIKIIDFGIAKANLQTELTKIGTIKGKFNYMSPEQATAKAVDARTDIFALGIMLWELVSDQALFSGKNDLEIITKIKNDPIPSLRAVNQSLPVQIENIVKKALEKNPDMRYQKASDIKYEIDLLMHMLFPNYRSEQFSAFVKSLYSEQIANRVAQLSLYSKEKIDQIAQIQPTNLKSKKIRKSQSENDTYLENRSEPLELPDGFDGVSKIQMKKDVSFEKMNPSNLFSAEVNPNYRKRAGQFFSTSKPREEQDEDSSQIFGYIKLFLGQFTTIIYLAGVASVVYYCFREFGQFYEAQTAVTNLSSLEGNPELDTLKSTTPINQVPIDYRQVQVDDFSKNTYDKLKNSAKLAYANIYIENAKSKDVRIFVNGKELIEKSPIKMYPIYANQVTKITAYDTKQNIADEKKIYVEAGKTTTLRMYLHPYTSRKK